MRKKEKIAGILLISLGILILLSLLTFNSSEKNTNQANEVQHKMGLVGLKISYFLIKKTIGYFSFIFPLLIIVWGVNSFKTQKYRYLFKISLYLVLISFYFSIGTAMVLLPKNIEPAKVVESCSKEPWGMIGGLASFKLYQYTGGVGSIIVFLTAVIITILSIVEINLPNILDPIKHWIVGLYELSSKKQRLKAQKRKRRIVTGRGFSDVETEGEEIGALTEQLERPSEEYVLQQGKIFDDEQIGKIKYREGDEKQVRKRYMCPPPSLLDQPPDKEDEVSWDEFMTSAKTLEDKLADFGIQGKVIEINPGPVITRYEIEPAPGIKVNRFTSLADDLALVMRAKRIRVIAPIPGKAAIGIEIPNLRPSVVYLKEIIDSPQFKSSKFGLPLALGKTIAGDIFVADLVTMPHLLIAGATGSGKSVCLHTIIASLLFKARPSRVQLMLIDPKRLELTPYAALKNHHLIYIGEEVATTASNAVLMLKSLELEMERRYELLARAGVRNIEDYNTWVSSSKLNHAENGELLSYIILIIDELADLMLTAAREVEEPIARLTQMSRAVGIHLIVATQRPSVDVITGVIKANFPARMAFQVATKTDSRTILDMNGAEKLLGKGDMLFLPPANPEPVRIHNAFISHEEVKRIIEHIKQQPAPSFKTKLITEEEYQTSDGVNRRKEERDELFNEALKLVVRHQQGSSSLLQRRLKIGYTRAARIIDQLEEAGFVGPFDGSKARQVLIDDEQLREMGIV